MGADAKSKAACPVKVTTLWASGRTASARSKAIALALAGAGPMGQPAVARPAPIVR